MGAASVCFCNIFVQQISLGHAKIKLQRFYRLQKHPHFQENTKQNTKFELLTWAVTLLFYPSFNFIQYFTPLKSKAKETELLSHCLVKCVEKNIIANLKLSGGPKIQ